MFIIYSPRVKETGVNMAGLERQGGVSGFLSKLWKQACSLC